METIKNLSLKWKFGIVFLFALLTVMLIFLVILRGVLNSEFDALYGDPGTKGIFVADLLIHDITPIIEKNIDSQELQQTLDAYKSLYGPYGLRYIFLLDDMNNVMVDTFKDRVPQSLVELNLLPEKQSEARQIFSSGNKQYYDCAVELPLPEKKHGTVRIGVVEQHPGSPVWQKLKLVHVKRIFNPLLLLSLLFTILLTVLMIAAFTFFIVRRIETVTQITERMSFGELEIDIPIQNGDELGNLEDTLERMRSNTKDAIDRLKRRK